MKPLLTTTVIVLALAVSLAGCGSIGGKPEQEATSSAAATVSADVWTSWLDAPLNDPVTGKTFKVSDYKGKRVLFHVFAVWDKECERQQVILKALAAEKPDIVVVAVDVDSTENALLISDAWKERGLTVPVAIASPKLTQALIDQFGPFAVTTERAPIVFISADQASARLLTSGVKTAKDLKAELVQGE